MSVTERIGPAGGRSVLVTSRSFSSGSRDLLGELAEAGLTVVRGPADHRLDALRPLLAGTVGWIAGTGPVTEAHLSAAPRLTVLARYGVGVDAVDLEAAAARGVVVTNTPGANTEAVADLTIGLLLAALRGIPAGDRRVRSGSWTISRGRELGALTVGIVGFGRIGRAVGRRLSGFGATVLAYDPMLDAEAIRAAGAEPVELAELPARCTAISLHAPGGGRPLVDADWLAGARDGLILVNSARADLVDEPALAAALRSGRVAGYAADTLDTESTGGTSPLLAEDLADKVVVTPHLGAQTVEAIDRMGSLAVADLLAVLDGGTPTHPVRVGGSR
ncbi:phosphoglycerate dehydrogenase [Plantactinospora soyae]|uniref:D-3-phosphoglycerate dehydrogenase n=1 Tax=Plantactinospora soyae TaxID=1544732 RepID=A0A927M0I6_9ACTN|nr:phosphoglycerate dehydrogenase [Plantactinospora soyae]MBE1484446.1 D-3-phosphoglycerate dehydrogenase [Plantactinospora soyae]